MRYLRIIIVIILLGLLLGCNEKSNPTVSNQKFFELTDMHDSLQINLTYGDRAIINNELTIKFEDVTEDSRCPMDAYCIWAGNGEVLLKLAKRGTEFQNTVNTYLEPHSFTYGKYFISLKQLNPYPNSTEQIKKEDYNIVLVLRLVTLG